MPIEDLTMAAGFEKLEKQLDRLEKLFSRKKRVIGSLDSTVSSNRPATPMPFLNEFDVSFQTFPQPSFIRPTSSRMVAREEVILTPHSTRRARSLPESPSAPRLPTSPPRTGHGNPTNSEAPDNCVPIAAQYATVGDDMVQRSASTYPRTGTDEPSSRFLDFSFSAASKETENDSSSRRRSRPSSKSATRSTSVSLSPKARVDRKRYSAGAQAILPLDQQENDNRHISAQQRKPSTLTPLQRESHCLGAASPDHFVHQLMPAAPVPAKSSPEEADSYKRSNVPARPKSLAISVPNTNSARDLRKSTSLSKLPIAKSANSDLMLKEPSVNDFLTLSDDDIADGHAAPRAKSTTKPPASNPPTLALPPNPLPAPTPTRSKRAHPLLTLSAPLASRPATSAAFEAARIATKYQFDLVYVVNLWPSHMSRPSQSSPLSQLCGTPVATSPPCAGTGTPSPPESPASPTSGYDSGFEPAAPPRSSSLTGRLLAAYGLPSIMYPFRISAPVHQKVLRTLGWLEYRNDTRARDEFARGYSCSFYTGHSPARGRRAPGNANATNTTAGINKPKPANRGIVFAAFRLPREDGTPVCSDGEELEALHRDAEALVDMLIEIHMTQRRGRGVGVVGAGASAGATPRRCVAGPGQGRGLVKPGAPLVAI